MVMTKGPDNPEDRENAEAEAHARTAFARSLLEALKAGREQAHSAVVETDSAAVWLVGLAGGLTVILGSEFVEARRILGTYYEWTLLLVGASILSGVLYRVVSLWVNTRVLSQMVQLEQTIAIYASPAPFDKKALDDISALVRAYMGTAERQMGEPSDHEALRQRMQRLLRIGLVLRVLFTLCAGALAAALMLVILGLWLT
jgi:hypothetical protein